MSELPSDQVPRQAPPQDAALIDAPAPPAAERSLSRWQAFWFAARMMEIRLRFVLVLVGAGLLIGYWDTLENYWDRWTRPAVADGGNIGRDTEFYCPMDPAVIRDSLEPNGSVPKCPICGMPLSKRKKGQPMELPPGVVGRVQLSPARVRLAGIRTAEVTVQPLTREIRTVGDVIYDESHRARIVTRVSGYLEKLFVNKSFVEVCEGDPLAEIYSPELYAAVQELLISKNATHPLLVGSGRSKLKLLGIDDREIDEIIRRGDADYRLVLRSPRHGFVTRKDVLEGESVSAGQMLFEVADLTTIWIEADIFEKDVRAIHVGQSIEAHVESFPEKAFHGKVSLVYPELQTSTRTNRVRFEIDNADLLLRSGMYATVHLRTPIIEMEPFKTVLETSQQPIGDSEKLIAQQRICPVTGAPLGSMGEPVAMKLGGRPIYICCEGCRKQLESHAEYYLARMQTVTTEGVLGVPELAVIDTGKEKVVYIEREPGLYEGVEVKLGPKSGGFYAVIEGLLPGDRVAAAGAFLIDAETRLNPAASAAYFGAGGGPSGGRPSANGSGPSSDPGTSEPTQPSDDDLKNLEKLPLADRDLARTQQLCPVTGMPLGAMGVPIKIIVADESVFICCKGCAMRAERDAEKTVEKVRRWRASYVPPAETKRR
ncbi:MAG: efflux RND transporter periplasmic adaptor subunit [Pirellulales bacterium]